MCTFILCTIFSGQRVISVVLPSLGYVLTHLFSRLSAPRVCHVHVHTCRDIKCENLLMDTNYNIKLSDFGFARNNMINKNGQMKMSKTFCGSYAYASPEILKGIPYQPNTSDVWSIGVVLYAMVYGSLPFDDTTYQRLLKVSSPARLAHPPLPTTNRLPNLIPPSFGAIAQYDRNRRVCDKRTRGVCLN